MKKIALYVILLASGCTINNVPNDNVYTNSPPNDYYRTVESSLSTEPDIITALDTFLSLSGYDVRLYDVVTYKSLDFSKTSLISSLCVSRGNKSVKQTDCDEQNAGYSLFMKTTDEPACFISSNSYYYSDECILQRRKIPDSKICYFNYKKYMPQTVKISNDDEFLHVLHLYMGTRPAVKNCYSNTQLTSNERQLCADKINNFIVNYANKTLGDCKKNKSKSYNELIARPRFYDIDNFYEPDKNIDTLCPYYEYVFPFEYQNNCILNVKTAVKDSKNYNDKKIKKELEKLKNAPYIPTVNVHILPF